jgi:4-hydroxy-4-methyl-2-oxoglutarate aldolase
MSIILAIASCVGRERVEAKLEELIARYRRLHTAVAYDVLDAMGLPNQALHHAIKPLAPGMRVAGPAYTARGMSAAGVGPASSYQMYREMTPGCVLVMDMGGHAVAGPWGENTSLAASVRGAAGAVLDGGTRDLEQIEAMGFPVFARFVTPVFAKGRWSMVALNEPIQVSGQVAAQVRVEPADFVLGDRDGVVVIPQRLQWEVLEAAEELERIEEQIQTALQSGEDREEVYRRLPKFNHVRKPGGGPA